MGYFHDGHLALMNKGQQLADRVVVSLFVNPAQFGPEEDLETYPQDIEGDSKKAEQIGVDLLFCPDATAIYQDNHQTTVFVETLSQTMCGLDRPVHFRGVATVVTALFNIISPDCAVFGEKDFQQLAILRKLVHDLHFPIEIIGHEIVREPDGLAMSSRNAYLNSHEREVAPVLYRALKEIKDKVAVSDSMLQSQPLLDEAITRITQFPECSVDYLTIIDSSTLEPKITIDEDCRVAGAIKINQSIRLIDNMELRLQ